MFGVGPGQFGELLDGDPAAVLKAAFVDNVGSLFGGVGNNKVRAEVVGGCFEVCQ